MFHNFYLFFSVVMRSHVGQAGLKLLILLLPPPEG